MHRQDAVNDLARERLEGHMHSIYRAALAITITDLGETARQLHELGDAVQSAKDYVKALRGRPVE